MGPPPPGARTVRVRALVGWGAHATSWRTGPPERGCGRMLGQGGGPVPCGAAAAIASMEGSVGGSGAWCACRAAWWACALHPSQGPPPTSAQTLMRYALCPNPHPPENTALDRSDWRSGEAPHSHAICRGGGGGGAGGCSPDAWGLCTGWYGAWHGRAGHGMHGGGASAGRARELLAEILSACCRGWRICQAILFTVNMATV